MRFATSFLLLSLTGVAVRAECELQCFQDAPCVAGTPDFSSHPMEQDDNATPVFAASTPTAYSASASEHCACPHGWTGILCDVPFESCDGEHKCYNGGSCIPGLLDEFGNEQLFCDCTDAVTDDGEQFVGKFCEHPQTELCSAANNDHFCVNGGICNTQYPQFGAMCECDTSKYDGPHCEFKTGNVPDCSLDCGKGHCVLGIRDPKDIHDIGHLFTEEGGVMHCECPPNTSGSRCEISTGQCGEHECFHGGTCMTKEKEGETYHHCDCQSAHTETTNYAGRYCQYESTMVCFENDPEKGKVFCVNDGTCPEEPFEPCVCSEEYFGPSCEFMHEKHSEQNGPAESNTGLIIDNEDDDEIPNPVEDDDDETNEGGLIIDNEDDDEIPNPVEDDDDVDDDEIANPVDDDRPRDDDDLDDDGDLPEEDDDRPRDDDDLDDDGDLPYDDDGGDCRIVCDNGGTCKRGIKHHGIITEYVDGTNDFQPHDENFEHCVCTGDFVGLRCEHTIERCPSGQHGCLHGGKCVVNGDEESCDCASAKVDGVVHVAGKICEHKATEICTTGELEPAQPRSFCVNEGTCKAKIAPGQEHPGCNCVGDWIGPHCELKMPSSSSNQQEPTKSRGKPSAGAIVIIILSIITVMTTIGCAYCQIRKLQQRTRDLESQVALKANLNGYSDDPNLMARYSDKPQRSNSNGSVGSNYSAGTELPNLAAGESTEDITKSNQVYIGPPRDEDGHELHSVEIL